MIYLCRSGKLSECVLVSGSMQHVCYHTEGESLCVGCIECVCSYVPFLLKQTNKQKAYCPLGFSLESLQSETEKSRVSRKGCPDTRACRNGDNRLWIEEWRPVN